MYDQVRAANPVVQCECYCSIARCSITKSCQLPNSNFQRLPNCLCQLPASIQGQYFQFWRLLGLPEHPALTSNQVPSNILPSLTRISLNSNTASTAQLSASAPASAALLPALIPFKVWPRSSLAPRAWLVLSHVCSVRCCLTLHCGFGGFDRSHHFVFR